VNISSIGVQLTPVGSGYYSAAKAAIEGLSGALRGELAPLGISVTVVEPGAFRTDFAGRSLIQSATVIDDYAGTAGRRRKENDTMHGTQAGDPANAGAAIIAAVESGEPPAFLLLGPDALAAYRYIADGRASEIAKWEKLTTGTNFESRHPADLRLPFSDERAHGGGVRGSHRIEKGAGDESRSRRLPRVKGTTTERHDQHAEIISGAPVRGDDHRGRRRVGPARGTLETRCDGMVFVHAATASTAAAVAIRVFIYSPPSPPLGAVALGYKLRQISRGYRYCR